MNALLLRSKTASILFSAAGIALIAACSPPVNSPDVAPNDSATQPETSAPQDSGVVTDSGVVMDSGVVTDSGAATARVRVIHAAPGAPNVDVYAAGAATAALSNLAYGAASAYLTLPVGELAFDIRAAGASGMPAFTTPAVRLEAGRSYTVIAAGRLSSTDAADRFRVLALAEDFATDASNARVRIVHAGSDAPTVGIDVGNDNPSAPEVASLDRFADTGAAGVSLPGNAALQVGITAGGGRVTAFTTPNLGAGNRWFVIATGLLPSMDAAVDNGFGLLAVNQDGVTAWIRQNPRVHIVHAGADAPAVDVFAGPAGDGANPARTLEVANNLSFPTAAGPAAGGITTVQVPPGAYGFDIFPTSAGSTRPAGAPAFTVPSVTVEPGRQYMAIAAYFLAPEAGATPADSAFTVLPVPYAITADSGAATAPRIVAVHACGDAPAVDVGVVSGATFTPLFTNLARGATTAAAGTTAPTDPITIGVRANGSSTIAARFAVDLDVNQRVFAIAAGALTPRASDRPFGIHAVFANAGTIQSGAGAWSLVRLLPSG